MEEKQITLSGSRGAGTNHLRLLLGLVPGKEIRDFSGRRLSDDKKLYFCTNIQYHNNITSTESYKGHNWGRQSYWLRVESWTREYYKDTIISHEILPKQEVIFEVGDVDRVTKLYEAKCPGLNGLSYKEEYDRNKEWSNITVRGITTADVTVQTDDFFESNWVEKNLQRLLDKLDYGTVDIETARAVHHRWCNLNNILLKKRK